MPLMKTVLARPGSLYIGKLEGSDSIVISDPSAGWMVPKGIRHWETEATVVAREDLTEAVRGQIKATFPEEQIPPAKLPMAFHAASSSPFIAISRKLIPDLISAGVRVHTVGADKTSSGFFYFAEGGGKPPVRVQGDMLGLLEPTLTGDETTALLEQHMESLLDRVLLHLSDKALSEVALELAAALPRLNADGTGLEGCDLEAFEKEAQTLVDSAKGFEKELRELSDRLVANTEGAPTDVPLFGVAKREPQFELIALLDGKKATLPRRQRWIVRGEPTQGLAVGASPWSLPPPGSAAAEAVKKAAEEAEAAKKAAEAEAASAAEALRVAAAAKAAEEAAKAAVARAEAAAKKKADEAAVAKKAEEDAAAKKKADEAAAAKKVEEDAAAKKKAEEDAAAKTMADEAAAAKKAEEEAAAKKKADDAAAAKKAEEEAVAAKKVEKKTDESVSKKKDEKKTDTKKSQDTAAPGPKKAAPIEKAKSATTEPAKPAAAGSNTALYVIVALAIAAVVYFVFLKH
jgi:hypothetical protein